jgi:serine/threonine protein kinase
MVDETDSGAGLESERLETADGLPAGERPATAPPTAIGSTLGEDAPAGRLAEADPRGLPPEIGRYRVIRKLGEGGMGVVYEAEQQSPRRRVAVKVIKGGEFVDDLRIRMFQREADTLARLKHPEIAAIYEAGRTGDGQHFFAMELVSGATLDAHLRARGPAVTALEIRYRLALFRKIAEAVHYAHQRGVIHRDLKPSNIVVSAEPGPGAGGADPASAASGAELPGIKILDFGLARITDVDVAATQITEVGVIRGTLPYMSPEQALGNTDAIDIRTDVYALGVILYQMLTGARPYDVSGASLLEAVRVICEQPPATLAQRWPDARRVDHDLETIVRTALAKDPGQRYASAAELAEDVGRYLTLQPILAREPSTLYQLRKLVERNTLAAALAGAAAVVLVAVAVVMTVMYRQASRNIQRALAAEAESAREAETARQVSSFMQTLFRESNPRERSGGAITAREILDQGAARVEAELAGQPVVQARLMNAMGSAYRDLGAYGPATRLLEGAVERARAALGPGTEETIRLELSLSALLVFTRQLPRAEEVDRSALAAARALPGDHALLIANAVNSLAHGLLESGKGYKEAEELLRPSLASQRLRPDHENEDFAQALMFVGWSLLGQGRFGEAAQHLRESLALRRRLHAGDHPSIPWTLNLLGITLRGTGDYDGAEAAFGDALEMNRRLFGDVHPEIAYNLEGLASVAARTGRYGLAVDLQRRSVAMRQQVLQADLPGLANGLNSLAVMLWEGGDLAAAGDALEEALPLSRKAHGDRHPAVAIVLSNIGEIDALRGDLAGAAARYREALEILRGALGPRDPRLLIPTANLAEVTRRRGDPSGAEEQLRPAVDVATATLKDSDDRLAEILTSHAKALLDLDKPGEARAAAERALALRSANLAAGDWKTADTRSVLGACLARQGERSDAETMLEEARSVHPAGARQADRALRRLASSGCGEPPPLGTERPPAAELAAAASRQAWFGRDGAPPSGEIVRRVRPESRRR